jgi:hypothetical protein
MSTSVGAVAFLAADLVRCQTGAQAARIEYRAFNTITQCDAAFPGGNGGRLPILAGK